MHLIYQVGIHILYLLVLIASMFKPKARLWIKGRKGLFAALRKHILPSDEVVWVHCASLGEFEQGRPLITEIKNRYPNKKIVLTFFSPSGYEVQKNFALADVVCYLPLDTRFNARRFLKIVHPEKAFFIKYEYWYNYLSVLKKRNIPAYFVSAIFRPDQLFFKKYGKWYRKLLGKADHFFLQNENSADLLKSININNYTIVGDTRFDRVANVLLNAKPLEVVERFVNGNPVVVGGSTWKAEDALLKQFLTKNNQIKLILVPHEVENGSVDRLMQQFGNLAVRYSQAGNVDNSNKQVLVVDCYGVLTSLYQYATIAVVGGGFGVGIHNVLEPATFGMPIIFGPNFEKFKEATDLVEKNCAFPVNNIEEFNTVMNHLLLNPQTTQKIAQMSAQYVKDNVGATNKIIDAVFSTSEC